MVVNELNAILWQIFERRLLLLLSLVSIFFLDDSKLKGIYCSEMSLESNIPVPMLTLALVEIVRGYLIFLNFKFLMCKMEIVLSNP